MIAITRPMRPQARTSAEAAALGAAPEIRLERGETRRKPGLLGSGLEDPRPLIGAASFRP